MFEPLPALIRMERERQGLTQDALAKLAGISRSRLAALEKGDDNLTLKSLLKVSNTLGLTHLRVGGIYVDAAPPDLAVLAAATDAIEAARRIIDQQTMSREDFERVASTVTGMMNRVMKTVPDPGIAEAAERLVASTADLRPEDERGSSADDGRRMPYRRRSR